MKLMKNTSVGIVPIVGITDTEEPRHWTIEKANDPEIKQIKFPFKQVMRDREARKAELAKPGNGNFVIQFTPGQGSVKIGLKAQHEYFIHGDRLYKRLSWHDMGESKSNTGWAKRTHASRKAHGLRVLRNKKLVYYVKEIELKDEVKEAVMTALGEEL